MASEEEVSTFLSICGTDNKELATRFLEMAGGNMETAISLFFEHGGESQLKHGGGGSNDTVSSQALNDEELAQSLQQQAYQEESSYRPPDQARHEQLVDTRFFAGQYGGVGGMFQPLGSASDMFDESRPTGIFNQRLPSHLEDTSDVEESDYSEDADQFNAYEYAEETVLELDDDGNIQEYTKVVRKPKAMSKQERMTLLFRPPFDMMSKVDLDGAKLLAREKKKWIMLNIQAVDIFQCQMLNRDLWSHPEIKKLVKRNFVFLQYQYESRSAQSYVQFYDLNNRDDLPHIAILDPLTGERLRQWNRSVPGVDDFKNAVEDFLSSFSLDPSAANPTVKEPTPAIDPSTLSEEQQMKLAIQESLGTASTVDTSTGVSMPNEDSSEHQTPTKSTASTSEDPRLSAFKSIKPVVHAEPENKPGITTRVQIRTGDGKRIIRRFNAMDDTVRVIYEVIKSEIEGYETANFVLTTHARENLIDKLDETINDAGLKNSSILIELVSEE